MESSANRLLDEARKAPVKNAFRLGLEFMDRNRALAGMTMGVFFLLTLLEMIPVLGFLATVAVGVFAQAAQIYVGRAFLAAPDIEQYVTEAESATLKTFLTRYRAPAFGAWLGWVTLSILFVILFILFLVMSGADLSGLNEAALQDETRVYARIAPVLMSGIPVMLLALLLTYVYPIAQGRVIVSDTFGEAFKAVFSIFTPSVWAASMKGAYFSYVFFFSLALMGIAILVMVTMMLLALIPFLGMVLIFVWMIFLIYVFILLMGIANTMALAIAEG